MTYDPTQDPRYLGPDPVEVFVSEEATRIQRASAEKSLSVCQDLHDLFQHHGWKHVEVYLAQGIDALHTLLIQGGRDQRTEDVLRGKAQAMRALLNFPDRNADNAKELSKFINGSEEDTR